MSFKESFSDMKRTLRERSYNSFSESRGADIFNFSEIIGTNKGEFNSINNLSTFLKLNVRIILKVFSFLSIFDLLKFEVVSKYINRLVNSGDCMKNRFSKVVFERIEEKFGNDKTPPDEDDDRAIGEYRKKLIKFFICYSRFIYPSRNIVNAHESAIIKLIKVEKRKLLCSISEDKYIKLWDVKNLVLVKQFHIKEKTEVLYDIVQINDDYIASFSHVKEKYVNSHKIRIWKFSDEVKKKENKEEGEGEGEGESETDDDDDGEIQVIDECEKLLGGHTGMIIYIEVSKNRYIITGSRDSTVRKWDTVTGESQIVVYEDGEKFIMFCRICQDRIAVSTVSRKIFIFDLVSGDTVVTLKDLKHQVNYLTKVTGSNNTLACASHENIEIWDMETKRCNKILKGHKKSIIQILHLHDDKIASFSDGNNILIWSIRKKVPILELEYVTPIRGIKFLKNRLLLSWSDDMKIQLWDIKKGICIKVMEKNEQILSSVIEFCGGEIISCGYNKKIRIFDWNIDVGYKRSAWSFI